MKILFIAPRFHTNQYPLIKYLQKKNNVKFLSQYRGDVENYSSLIPTICKGFFFPLNLNFKNLDYSSCSFIPNFYFLIKYLKKADPDFVIIRHQYKILSYICILILKFMKKKIIMYDQNEVSLKVNKSLINNLWFKTEFFFRTYILNIPWYSPINNYKKNKIKKNCYMLPFAVEKNFNPKKKITTKKRIYLLTIGKFRERKNFLLLCKSINFLSNKFKFNFKLTIIGQVKNNQEKQYFSKIKKYISINKLEKKIILKKNISHSKIGRFYKKSNIFVLPSTREPAAISVLEAASYGIPVILSNTSGTRCYFKNNENSKFFKDQSQEDLQQKILFFLKSPQNIISYSKNIIRDFDKTMSIKNYEKHFKKILQKI